MKRKIKAIMTAEKQYTKYQKPIIDGKYRKLFM